MKTNLTNLLILFLIYLSFTSCIATHSGFISGSASLNSANFFYQKKDVYGVAQATYVLGIGGMSRQSLVMEAKENMLKSNPLLKNQALANVTMSFKSSGFLAFIVTTIKCTVSADIVEFKSNLADSPETVNQIKASDPEVNTQNPIITTDEVKSNVSTSALIKVGDEVKIINYFSTPVRGKVVEIRKGEYFDEYIVEYVKSNNKVKQVKLLLYQLEK